MKIGKIEDESKRDMIEAERPSRNIGNGKFQLLHPAYILTGVFVGYILGNTITPFVCEKNGKFSLMDDDSVVTNNQPYEFRPRKTLFVAVMTAGKFLENRASACNNTWGRHATVEYFAQTGSWKENHLRVVNLPGQHF